MRVTGAGSPTKVNYGIPDWMNEGTDTYID